ncbi:cytochrome P450 [Coprinellus micaceus]|uniref:Cytochrome P450 n=1 Tax=Coprinellus micaceus TaxID=71717 RepID=A0A4Y7TEM4_COPMI|nr:cytochrome P450 [Coprinellus micaceus]
MNPPTPVQVVAGVAIAWGTWKVLGLFFRKDPLHNIPGPPSDSWAKGNFKALLHSRAWSLHKEIAEQHGGVLKIHGFLGERLLYVFDPKALQHIVVKEQNVYEEADQFIMIVFGEGLLSTMGEQHRKQRKMLNPVFSIAHMREMIPIFYDVVHRLGDSFQAKVQNGPATIEVLNWMTRTALELIGQSGLGYSFDPLTENGKEHRFSVSAKLLVAVVDFLSLFWTDLRRYRDIVDVIAETSEEILAEKKAALRQGDETLKAQVGRGKDIMSILLKANMSASESDKLSDSELLGQMSSLTFAAMDTTSNALSRIFTLDDRLRKEISEALDDRGQLSYDDLINLPYLDAICRETMRLYPPVPLLIRACQQDSMLPVSRPVVGVDGKEMDEVFVPQGTKIFISTLASNRNAELWGPDAYEWKPDRWLLPLPDAVVNAKIPGVYSHLMTFLGGSRACIGFKFSQLEMKVVLVELISRFKFELGEHKNIYWQMGGIATPIIDENSTLDPQLPLKVTSLKDIKI